MIIFNYQTLAKNDIMRFKILILKLNKLKRKYGASIENILDFRAELDKRNTIF